MFELEIFSEEKKDSGVTEITYLITPAFKKFIKNRFSLQRWNNRKFDSFMKGEIFAELQEEKIKLLYFKGKIV